MSGTALNMRYWWRAVSKLWHVYQIWSVGYLCNDKWIKCVCVGGVSVWEKGWVHECTSEVHFWAFITQDAVHTACFVYIWLCLEDTLPETYYSSRPKDPHISATLMLGLQTHLTMPGFITSAPESNLRSSRMVHTLPSLAEPLNKHSYVCLCLHASSVFPWQGH